MIAFISKELLGHATIDVKMAVATCIIEVTRLTASEAPYDDYLIKELSHTVV